MTSTEIASASKIMLGSTEAVKMYIGNTLLYTKQSNTQQKKVWVRLTDPSITSSTPIYKIGVTDISQNATVCRVGFTKEPGLTNVSDPAEYPSRLWYSGDSQNKVAIHWGHGNSIYNQPQNWYPQEDNTGWLPYSDIHIQQSTISLLDNNITIPNVWVYDCLNGTYTNGDDEGNNPLYFYYSQTNSPLSNFYVLIDDTSEYTELEYISSTSGGNQYINLRIQLYKTLNTDYDIAMKFNIASGNANQAAIFACQDSDNDPWPGTFVRVNSSSGKAIGRYIGGTAKDNTLGNLGADIELPVQTSPNKNVTSLNNNNTTHQYGTSLFCAFVGGTNTPARYCNAKLYYFKLFVGGTLVRDLIPCKNSNNVVGMYDVVNNVFYTSPNGNAFVAGPAV